MSVTVHPDNGQVWADGRWLATFADRAEAESYAEAKRSEIAKAQPYYVDDCCVRARHGDLMAVYTYRGQMPSGTPDRWQAELLAYCCDWLNAKWREVQG